MYPYIFGVIDSYVLFLFIGVICAFLLLSLYFKFVYKKDKYFILDLLFSGIISVLFGVVFACLLKIYMNLHLIQQIINGHLEWHS